MEKIQISTEYIKLDQFLKWVGIADTGSLAKDMILSGEVLVNGEIEERRGKKIYPGDTVEAFGQKFIVE
ncbi:MAG: S4 domain-containing protein YaaA [Cetobacterium sp.]|uniref:Ribosome-associated protein n=1 Tax=Cetobacterium ceti TaxID=180163 RepID=A0A1T4PKV0_9FUSO|nr:S4 domain-containing protein YaaA [Cetobacterium ceti]MCJ8341604.1 S4 domain-containing protein YaaA [Cetobacterium sp.]SJZ91981.1 ribosome-associated protein [Cetobacterium ceti]